MSNFQDRRTNIMAYRYVVWQVGEAGYIELSIKMFHGLMSSLRSSLLQLLALKPYLHKKGHCDL